MLPDSYLYRKIPIPLIATNNIRVLPGCTGIISLVLKLSKTSFIPHHMIFGKGIAYVKTFVSTLPLRPVEIEFKNNRCCIMFLFYHFGCNMSNSCLLWKMFFNKQYVVFVTVLPLLSCIVLCNTLEVTRKISK